MNNTAPLKHQIKSVVCITTYNRIDCARINQEIIKLNYKNPFPIVHACSGLNYEKYLEDIYLHCEPADLQHGALNLLKQSINNANQEFNPEYIIHLEGDTWLMSEKVIGRIIRKMDRNKKLILCTSAWDNDKIAIRRLSNNSLKLKAHGVLASILRYFDQPYRLSRYESFATQFFVIRNTPKAMEMLMAIQTIPGLELEEAFYKTYYQYFNKFNLFRLREREPVHPKNRYISKKLHLYSQHWPAKGTANDSRPSYHFLYISPLVDGKKETLEKYKKIRKGEYIQKLLNSDSFEYYNPGASKT